MNKSLSNSTAETALRYDGKREYPHGDLAVWAFIYAELLVFSVFFVSYAFARMLNPEVFVSGQLTLNPWLGMVNTILLLTSGWLAAAAVLANASGKQSSALKNLWVAILFGVGFLFVKGYEIGHHFAAGYDLDTDAFHFLYLFMGSFHFLHVVLGAGVLVILAVKVKRGDYGPDECQGLESGAAYWHMVDIVWMILFPLVYLMR